MIILIVLSVIVIGFFLYHCIEFRKEDLGKALIGFLVILGLIWFGLGQIAPYKDVYVDVTKEVQIAKGENFVVFSYQNKLLKSTHSDVVKNPENSRVYLKRSANIFGSTIEEENLNQEDSLIVK